ncbi:MAG: hypothetical protein HYR49_07885 [Gammaproteobacteria bacterium]|nr:hypothetical protein [Gammaproteobacteria bacterium]
MNWLTFIATLVDSLAWPAVVIAILFIVRERLPEMVTALRRLKYKDLELEFETSTAAIEKKSEEALPSVTKAVTFAGSTEDDERNRLTQIAEISPRSAILEAWLLVERAAVDVIRKRGISNLKSMPGPMQLRDYLRKGELLNETLLGLFEELRFLRNEAVHVSDAQFTPKAVVNYIRVALKMAGYLEQRASEL